MLVTRVWRKQPGKFFCISTKSASKKWQDHFFTKREFDDVLAFVQDNEDKDVYWCPHGFREPRRLRDVAVPPNLFWSDMDAVDPEKTKWRPTIAIESSPNRFVGLWETDSPVTDSLNQRLVYAIGADKGGWDFTQVLRVPGTFNHKYQARPKVRTLWSDGPTYRTEKMDKELPRLTTSTGTRGNAAELYRKWQKKMTGFLRKNLMSGARVTLGKRSDVLWRLGQELLEIGCSVDEALVLLKASPWNKFIDRRDGGDEQLRRELEKGIDRHFDREEEEEDGPRILMRSMAEVEEENIEWIWYPYLALRELTILEGDPGLGKSYLAQIVGVAIADGKKLPTIKPGRRVSGKVVYFDLENSAGTVTKKRLVTNGLQNIGNFYQCEEGFSIDDPDAMGLVYEHLEVIRPKLVVFDTLNTYIGKADAFKGHEAQQAMKVFREIAMRFNCAVVVLRHLTKSVGPKALYRGQGSISISGLARVVMTVGLDPEDSDTRVMAVTKLNVTRPPKALTFTIDALPDTLKHQDRSMFHWGDFVDLTSEDILEAAGKKNGDHGKEGEEAKKFLEKALADEEIEVGRLERMAEKRSVGKKALWRAAEEMGIVKRAGRWSLPTQRKDEE